jgi:mono/diheme cytochrome c family protein
MRKRWFVVLSVLMLALGVVLAGCSAAGMGGAGRSQVNAETPGAAPSAAPTGSDATAAITASPGSGTPLPSPMAASPSQEPPAPATATPQPSSTSAGAPTEQPAPSPEPTEPVTTSPTGPVTSTATASASATDQPVVTMTPQAGNADLVATGVKIYKEQYCGICHQLGAAGTGGLFGPTHDGIGSTAEQRINEASYSGAATTAGEYIRESIVEPKVFIVPGYSITSHPMPAYDFLSEEQILALVEMLLAQQ